MSPLDKDLASDWARLRARSLKLGTQKKFVKSFSAQLRVLVDKTKTQGDLFSLREGKRLLGAVARVQDRVMFQGMPVWAVNYDIDLRSKKAKGWLKQVFETMRGSFNSKTFLFVPAVYKTTLKTVVNSGFAYEALILDGNPKVALRGYRKKYSSWEFTPLPETVTIRLMKASDVGKVFNLFKKVFKKEPQYGWQLTNRHYLKGLLKELKALNRNVKHFVILTNGNLKGYFGYVHIKGPRGTRGGLSLCFDKSIRGMGLVHHAYFTLLKHMVREKIPAIQGGTAREPVMRLGLIMKRKPIAVLLRYGSPYFKARHFERFYPLMTKSSRG